MPESNEEEEHSKALDAVSSGKLLLMVHSPGCGHCQAMKPAWAALSASNLPSGVVVASVRAGSSAFNALPDAVKKATVGVPLIAAVLKNGQIEEYKGDRTTAALTEFAHRIFGSRAKAGGGRTRKTKRRRRTRGATQKKKVRRRRRRRRTRR